MLIPRRGGAPRPARRSVVPAFAHTARSERTARSATAFASGVRQGLCVSEEWASPRSSAWSRGLLGAWRESGTLHRHLHYGVTRLPPDGADAARLLALKRGHWGVEDRSLIHTGAGPAVMCPLRDTAIGVLHLIGCRTTTVRLRALADCPTAALALVLGVPTAHAYTLR